MPRNKGSPSFEYYMGETGRGLVSSLYTQRTIFSKWTICPYTFFLFLFNSILIQNRSVTYSNLCFWSVSIDPIGRKAAIPIHSVDWNHHTNFYRFITTTRLICTTAIGPSDRFETRILKQNIVFYRLTLAIIIYVVIAHINMRPDNRGQTGS